tara:strand:+ start:166 stop:393 length:228 start_codon:yes stop_codon:yes gene_type:complete
MEYQLLDDEDKQAIVLRQVKELEAQHFAFMLLEPSKLQQIEEHTQWASQVLGLEQQLSRFKKNVYNLGISLEEEE